MKDKRRWTWGYRVVRYVDSHTGESCEAIHEVYYDADGKPYACSEKPSVVKTCGKYGLLSEQLDKMRQSLEMDVLLEADFFERNPTDFQLFFLECARLCAMGHIGPDDYVWDLNNPGIWLDKYDMGLSPEDAVKSAFRLN